MGYTSARGYARAVPRVRAHPRGTRGAHGAHKSWWVSPGSVSALCRLSEKEPDGSHQHLGAPWATLSPNFLRDSCRASLPVTREVGRTIPRRLLKGGADTPMTIGGGQGRVGCAYMCVGVRGGVWGPPLLSPPFSSPRCMVVYHKWQWSPCMHSARNVVDVGGLAYVAGCCYAGGAGGAGCAGGGAGGAWFLAPHGGTEKRLAAQAGICVGASASLAGLNFTGWWRCARFAVCVCVCKWCAARMPPRCDGKSRHQVDNHFKPEPIDEKT